MSGDGKQSVVASIAAVGVLAIRDRGDADRDAAREAGTDNENILLEDLHVLIVLEEPVVLWFPCPIIDKEGGKRIMFLLTEGRDSEEESRERLP